MLFLYQDKTTKISLQYLLGPTCESIVAPSTQGTLGAFYFLILFSLLFEEKAE